MTETMRIEREGDRRTLRFAHVELQCAALIRIPRWRRRRRIFYAMCARENSRGRRARSLLNFSPVCGNHTVALAPYFPDGATAVEMDAALRYRCGGDSENFIRNGVENGARAVRAGRGMDSIANVNDVDRARTVFRRTRARGWVSIDDCSTCLCRKFERGAPLVHRVRSREFTSRLGGGGHRVLRERVYVENAGVFRSRADERCAG